MLVPPALGVRPLGIAARIEELGPARVIHRRGVEWSRDMRLAGVVELVLRPSAAPWAVDQQHQCATAAAAASSISRPVRKRSSENGAAIGCGSSRATVAANTCPEPGVALNPPVPQPQFTYSP